MMMTRVESPPLGITAEDMPELDQVLDGIPIYTDTALYAYLFGENIPFTAMVVVEKGQKWLEAHEGMAIMANDNRLTHMARAKQIGRRCLVTLSQYSPFIIQPATGPKAI